MFGYPLRSINLAGNGYTVRQIRSQAKNALQYQPRFICVMAGTNDIFGDPDYDVDAAMEQYALLIDDIKNADVRCVVTLVPFTASGDQAAVEKVRDFNNRLSVLAGSFDAVVVDLNPRLAPDAKLLDNFRTDGVHLSDEAYSVWASEMRQHVR